MRHYVTCCYPHQLPVLAASMQRHCKPFTLHVLAWDFDARMPPSGVVVTGRGAFLARHPEMRPDELPGPARTAHELATTVRWTFAADVMEDVGQPVTLLDGDLFFFSSLEPVFREDGFARAAAAVTPHDFPPAAAGLPGVTADSHGKYGRQNSGWVTFNNVYAARFMASCTRGWAYAGWRRMPDGRERYGDQGWLEDLAETFEVHEIESPVNVGPWSIHNLPIALIDGCPHVLGTDDPGRTRGGFRLPTARRWEPLIAYHFQSLRRLPNGEIHLADAPYAVTPRQVDLIYRPYLEALGWTGREAS